MHAAFTRAAASLGWLKPMAWLMVWLMAPVFAQAQSPLPKGMLEAKPQAWEVETKQAAGHGSARFQFVGTLRCKNLGEGIVGVRLLRSEVVDMIQIGCARIDCTDDIDCSWKELNRGAYAGKPNDKSQSSITVCGHDSVIAGYRARLKVAGSGPVDYVGELQFQCARVIGAAMAAGKGESDGGVPVSDEQRTWLTVAASEGAAATLSTNAPWQIEARCEQRAATGVSLAVGAYQPTGQAVIQALSLFCTKPPPMTGMGTPE